MFYTPVLIMLRLYHSLIILHNLMYSFIYGSSMLSVGETNYNGGGGSINVIESLLRELVFFVHYCIRKFIKRKLMKPLNHSKTNGRGVKLRKTISVILR